MLRKLVVAVVATLAFLAMPSAAFAADDPYPPTPPPQDPSLAGSLVDPICDGDVPYIRFSITLTDPDLQATGSTAYLILSDGTNSVTLTLGDVSSGELSGSILWPGASVDANGNPTGWPGWAQVGGTWVQIPGNFGWTRNITSATISVNPQIVVPLSYPPASASCASPATPASSNVEMLSSTGVSAWTIPIGLAAVAVVAIGMTMVLVRRRAAR